MVEGYRIDMTELLDFYQQQIGERFSSIPWFKNLQESALTHLKKVGFPTIKNEDWKYTSVDALLQHHFKSEDIPLNNDLLNMPDVQVPFAYKLSLINGALIGADDLVASFPKGVIIKSLKDAFIEHSDKIKPYLSKVMKEENGFNSLNTAMMNNGLFIYLPKGVCLNEPIYISHRQDKSNQASYLRHLIVLEQESSISIIEDYEGEACYFTSAITEASLEAKSKLTHYKIMRESNLAYHVGHIAVNQKENSQFDSHSFNISGKLIRSDIAINLSEPYARCLMNGVYLTNDNQHIDHHTVVRHEAPDCTSEQDYKGILQGDSKAVFNGRIVVEKGANHTVAKQQNKNLLLSSNTEIDTKPQLEIFADDVICTHGATVGQLDEEALFYLATRGIGYEQACQYLVNAFITANLCYISDINIKSFIETLLNV